MTLPALGAQVVFRDRVLYLDLLVVSLILQLRPVREGLLVVRAQYLHRRRGTWLQSFTRYHALLPVKKAA